MINRQSGEIDYLANLTQKLAQLRDFLNSAELEQPKATAAWLECLLQLKAIQGNSDNAVSFMACLLAKDFLITEFGLDDYDVAAKPQGAPGLDIDLPTASGGRIIGEIKTTIPYSGATNDFGANQKAAIQKDFKRLAETSADQRFFFVTDPETFRIAERRYAAAYPTLRIVLLPHDKTSPSAHA